MSQHEDSYGTRKRLTFIAEVIRRLKPRSVLDVGCGVGQVSHPLAEMFPDTEFHGVDSDETSIDYARKNHVTENLSFYYELDATGQHDYGLVIASEVIEHVEAPDEFLRTLRRRLSDSGRLILTVPNGYGPFEMAAMVEATMKLTGLYSLLRKAKIYVSGRSTAAAAEPVTLAVSPHINFFTYKDITGLLEHTGFEVERYCPRTVFCGFGFDQILRSRKALDWNSAISERLPPCASSDWMFVAARTEVEGRGQAYTRGLLSRSRRYLYEKQYGLR